MADRVLAWLVTGPVGHLAAALTDWGVIGARLARARITGRPVEW